MCEMMAWKSTNALIRAGEGELVPKAGYAGALARKPNIRATSQESAKAL